MKKAKLDILEELPGIDIDQPEAESITDAEIVAEGPEQKSRPWAFNKLLLIAVPAALIAIGICSTLVYFAFFSKTAESPKSVSIAKVETDRGKIETGGNLGDEKSAVSVPALPVKAVQTPMKTAYIKDFMIDLKDSRGNSHILLCDFAFDLGPDQTQEMFENNVDVRNIIYRTTQKRSAVALKSLEERKKLKQDLLLDLDQRLGKGSVKDVYFINYFIM